MSRINAGDSSQLPLPVTTLGIMGLCTSVYVWQFLADPELGHFTMNPRSILYKNEYYRIVTACFCHVNLMHIIMNMMSFMAIGSSLEKRFGSLWHFFTICSSVLLTSLSYVFVAYMMHALLGRDGLFVSNAAGFSGVIFHLLVIETNIHPNLSRQVFGLFNVSSSVYPWALLVIIQIIMPTVSFMGHLAGIMCGSFQIYGVLNILLPSEEFLRSMDEWQSLQSITSLPGYIKTPTSNVISSSTQSPDSSAIRQTIRGLVTKIFKFIGDLCETVKVAIFGRGDGANSNIRFTPVETNALGISSGAPSDDNAEEDEWIGLPPMSSTSTVESRIL